MKYSVSDITDRVNILPPCEPGKVLLVRAVLPTFRACMAIGTDNGGLVVTEDGDVIVRNNNNNTTYLMSASGVVAQLTGQIA